MRTQAICIAVAFCAFGAVPESTEPGTKVLETLRFQKSLPSHIKVLEGKYSPARRGKGGAEGMRIEYEAGSNPGIEAAIPDTVSDWSSYAGLAVDVQNSSAAAVDVFIRVNSISESGAALNTRASQRVSPEQTGTVRLYFTNHGLGPYWGMRGTPAAGPVLKQGPGLGGTAALNLSQVSSLRVYILRAPDSGQVVLSNLRLFEPGSAVERPVPSPFIDQYGQFVHADWPGKIHNDAEFRTVHEAESSAMAALKPDPVFDQFGGWANGPQLEATGWFRTGKVDGKWWLVTPEGRLFLSLGVTCIGWGDSTFVSGREEWFEWVPEKDGGFAEFRGHAQGVHSMAEPINGTGDTANFYGVNLKRRFGNSWREASRELAYQRLRAWGFNTIANWATSDVQQNSPIPFTVCSGTGGRRLEGSGGYWGKMVDVFDDSFVEETDRGIANTAREYAANPLVVGWFVDNEMSWSGVAAGALASPTDQAGRKAFVEDLVAKYGSIDRLTEAWGTQAADWDSLRAPTHPSQAVLADCEAFEYRFARKYFDTVAEAIHRHAPNHLYLGCRFTLAYCPQTALKACSEVADVISINLYQPGVREGAFADLGKPYMIGEFHFGALDRGMFHQGLVAAEDQASRAQMYVDFVKSVALSPLFVGCHWFQYCDQPCTGRFMDGENYSIGLVAVTDVPYPELTGAALDVHRRAYPLRAGIK